MMFAWRLSWVCFVLLSACSSDPPPMRGQGASRGCNGDLDCDADELCIFGLCSASCVADDSCTNGATCFDTGRGSACVRLQDNACVSTVNCPARTRCIAGRCLTECESGGGSQCLAGSHCLNGVCVEGGGDGGRQSSAGASGAGSRGAGSFDGGIAGATSPSELTCPTGSVQCDAERVVTCNEQSDPEVEETCTFACQDGACTGLCAPKALRCDDGQRESCDDSGNWQVLEVCSRVCTPGACVDTCVEGTRQCNGSTVMRCSSGAFIEEVSCGFLCSEGTCTGECAPGSKRCMNNAASSCGTDGRWSPAIECGSACVGGSCSEVCTPGSKRCAGSAAYQLCSDQGQWGTNQSCQEQACGLGSCTGVCRPGATRCEGTQAASRCEPNGQWSAPTSCLDGACNAGRCEGSASNCASGQRRCDPSGAAQVQVCAPDGTWQAGPSCQGQACLEGACQVPGAAQCVAGTRRCDLAGLIQICNAAGTWGLSQPCAIGQRCKSQGQCSAMTCGSGASPDWFSGAPAGNPTLDDPRWGGAPLAEFAHTFGFNSGGYMIVFDQATKELSVSIRVTMGPSEAPDGSDYVYFGVTTNSPGEPAARAAAISLTPLLVGEGPVSMTSFTPAVFSGAWQDEAGATWLNHVSAWRGGPNDGYSWAVNMRVSLSKAGVDFAMPFRIAVAAHAAGAPSDLTTPASSGALSAQPSSWALASLNLDSCAGRVRLQK